MTEGQLIEMDLVGDSHDLLQAPSSVFPDGMREIRNLSG
jgi:hypothetical protein